MLEWFKLDAEIKRSQSCLSLEVLHWRLDDLELNQLMTFTIPLVYNFAPGLSHLKEIKYLTFCKPTFHIPINIPHLTSQTSYMPEHPTFQTFHISNLPYIENPTSQTFHISNLPYTKLPKRPTLKISHILNIPQPVRHII